MGTWRTSFNHVEHVEFPDKTEAKTTAYSEEVVLSVLSEDTPSITMERDNMVAAFESAYEVADNYHILAELEDTKENCASTTNSMKLSAQPGMWKPVI